MDVVNFDGLKAQDKIIDPADVDPNEDYFLIGKYTNHYRTNSMKATNYPIYAIKAGDVMGGGGTPTLQQVLDFNHDLVDGNNFQGTGAGSGNTGIGIIANGTNAANGNTGDNVIALGTNAGIANPLSGMFIISNSELPSYADHSAAVAAISPTGIPNNTYIYHNQATMSIGAVRL